MSPRSVRLPAVLPAAAAGAVAGAAAALFVVVGLGVRPGRAVVLGLVVLVAVAATGLLVPGRAAPLLWPDPPRGDRTNGWHHVALRAAALRREKEAP